MTKEKTNQLVRELYSITQEQANCLAQKDIERFLELAEIRQELIASLTTASQDQELKAHLAEENHSKTLQLILSIDNRNANQITQMMKTTQEQLRQMTSGRNAFYAYAGRTEVGIEEAHFIDKQQA